MKILLLGEYSGLFNCLKDGLVELGHDVTLISDGDGFKNYPSDYSWRVRSSGRFAPYVSTLKAFTFIDKFTGYDVVHVIAPFLICPRPSFWPILFRFLKKNNQAVFLCGAGMTSLIYQYWLSHESEKYHKYIYGYIDDAGGRKEKVSFASKKIEKAELEILSMIDGYIPIMHEYSAPFFGNDKLLETIPIPINITKYQYFPNVIKDKMTFFHGITKSCKGGSYIIEAFECLKDKYKKDVDFLVRGSIPFNQYISFLQSVNIVVDDANAYSLGMNSLFSMAQGRVVMGGAEPIANAELKYGNCPAINIISDADAIAEQIEKLISKKDALEEMGSESRKFVENYHNYISVAEKYVNIWQANGRK